MQAADKVILALAEADVPVLGSAWVPVDLSRVWARTYKLPLATMGNHPVRNLDREAVEITFRTMVLRSSLVKVIKFRARQATFDTRVSRWYGRKARPRQSRFSTI